MVKLASTDGRSSCFWTITSTNAVRTQVQTNGNEQDFNAVEVQLYADDAIVVDPGWPGVCAVLS